MEILLGREFSENSQKSFQFRVMTLFPKYDSTKLEVLFVKFLFKILTVSSRVSPGAGLNSKFRRIFAKIRNSSAFAKDSPKHCLFPMENGRNSSNLKSLQ